MPNSLLASQHRGTRNFTDHIRDESSGQLVPVVPRLLCAMPDVPLVRVADGQVARRLATVRRAPPIGNG